MSGIKMSEKGELTRQSIVQLIENREARCSASGPRGSAAYRDKRIRGALATMLSREKPAESAISQLVGLDEDGWQTWIELQQWIAHAMKGNGGFDAIEAACEELGIEVIE